MTTDPRLVSELRELFKSGATPSAVIRRVAERYAGEARLDAVVRNYFRVAFDVPVARIGPEMVEAILGGAGVPALNHSLLHRMIETRSGWDTKAVESEVCWLDGVTATSTAALVADADPQTVPQLAGSWDQMDDAARVYLRRVLGNYDALYEQVRALAALAEALQQQIDNATSRLEPAAASV